MPHYSFIVQDYYYYKKELVTLIDVVDIDRQMRLREEAIIHKKMMYIYLRHSRRIY